MNTKILFSLLAFLSLTTFSMNLSAQTPKADLLDIRFNADGTATDVSGKNRTIVSSKTLPTVAYNNTYKRYAATFTGTRSDYYYFDYSADQAFIEEVSGDFTMECLMRIDNLSKESTPFCTTQNSGFGFDISWYSNNDLSFMIHNGSGYVAVTDESIKEGVYYHAVGVVRHNDAIIFYVNGELIGSKPFTTVRLPGNSSKRLYIGGDVDGSGYAEFAFKGEVVVARMYSQALSEQEVKSVYNALPNGETGIVTVKNDGAEAATSIHTLSGIRVSQPQTRGIYIINGKKMFMK